MTWGHETPAGPAPRPAAPPKKANETMTAHRFQIGDIVEFTNSHVVLPVPSASCQIVRLLSTDGDDPQYRVKCPTEDFERVVRESQLSKGAGDTADA